MRAQTYEMAVVEHQNFIGVAYRAGALGNYEHRGVVVERAQICAEPGVGCIVERRRAVVENENFGLLYKSAGNSQPLALAARKFLPPCSTYASRPPSLEETTSEAQAQSIALIISSSVAP